MTRDEILTKALELLAFARGQLCPECQVAWPLCDKADENRLSEYRRCSGAQARAALEAAAKAPQDIPSDQLARSGLPAAEAARGGEAATFAAGLQNAAAQLDYLAAKLRNQTKG